MNEEAKQTIADLANALQVITLLSTHLRQELAASTQRAGELQGAADRAIEAIKRMHPSNTNHS
jgi:hypothetical protein